jgi:hypothetical protein
LRQISEHEDNLYNVSRTTILERLKIGLSVEDALGTPLRCVGNRPLALARSDKNIHGLSASCIRHRLRKGWSEDDALAKPLLGSAKGRSQCKSLQTARSDENIYNLSNESCDEQKIQLCVVYRPVTVGGKTFRSWWGGIGWAVDGHRAIIPVEEYQQIRKKWKEAISIFVDRHGNPIKD